MAAEGISISLNRTEVDRLLGRLRDAVTDLTPALEDIAVILEESVRQNFVEGGRPEAWLKSKRALEQDGQTLRDSNRLMNSITHSIEGETLRVGTNVEYAAAHHFGVDKTVRQQVREYVCMITKAFGKKLKEPIQITVKKHERDAHLNLPARPFM